MTTRSGLTPASSRRSSCSSADLPGMPVCVKIGRFVATCALPTARNTLRSSAVISSHDPISPNAPEHLVIGLLDERLDDVVLAHRGDLFRIERLVVEPAAGDDGHAGLHRDLAQEVDVASHVRVAAVDDAGEVAVARGGLHFRGHQVRVAHDVRAGRRRRTATRAAAPRGCGRQTVRGANRRRRREKSRHEVGRELHVFVKQRRAAGEILGRVVLEDGADDRAFGERRRGRLRRADLRRRGRRRAHAQHFQRVASVHCCCSLSSAREPARMPASPRFPS